MNKVGMFCSYWNTDWKADYKVYVKRAAKLNFDVLEVNTKSLMEMSFIELDELKKVSENEGIEICYCIGFPKEMDVSSLDDSTRRRGIEYAKRTLEKINYLDGKIFGGGFYSYWPGTLEDGVSDKRPYFEKSVKSVEEIAKTAEDYDIQLCMEVLNRFEQFLINTVDEGLEYIQAVGSSNLNLLLDTFHLNIEEDSIKGAILAAGDKLGHFHIGECNRKVPGEGRMPWNEIANALKTINYQGRIVMEPFIKKGGEIGRDIKVWRDLSDNATEAEMDLKAKDGLEFIRDVMNLTVSNK